MKSNRFYTAIFILCGLFINQNAFAQCQNPSEPIVFLNGNGALISWQDMEAVQYHFKYKKKGEDWQLFYQPEHSITLSGLSEGEYIYRINTQCQTGIGADGWAGISDEYSFTIEGGNNSSNNLWTKRGNYIVRNSKVLIGFPDTKISDEFNLFVEKGIITEKFYVDYVSEWADYVFDSNYKRNSLNVVDAYILENKHLPNVPSEKEVKENGFDLAKMDATLLRQIEELWLHTIDLDKENNQLKQEVKELSKRLAKIEKLLK